jgi:release factor glutamine methyltransferase
VTSSAPVPSSTVSPRAGLDAALRSAADRLTGAGVASPRVDAELLAAHVLGLSRGEVVAAALAGRMLDTEHRAALDELVELRAGRVPLQHLTGRAPFRGLELRVGPGVFVPRPETEVVAGLAVDAVRELVATRGGRSVEPDGAGVTDDRSASRPDDGPLVVDLCTGSAAIALAVAAEVPSARVVALELDPHAHAWAALNVGELAVGRVDLRLGDVAGADTGVLADLAGAVDVVVANPPYIPPGSRPLDPEVADHDPEPALFGGGPDGLAVPRAVISTAAGLLRPGGALVMEHADSQGPAVRRLVADDRWREARTVPDLTDRDRVLVVRRADLGDASQR